MGSTSSTTQSSSALKYELRNSWADTDLTRCWSAATFKGCAWRPSGRVNKLCSYVNDTASFTYYPNAAPLSQAVYSRGNSDTAATTNEVYACPDDDRFIAITVKDAPAPLCLCKNSKVKYIISYSVMLADGISEEQGIDPMVLPFKPPTVSETCSTDYGRTTVSCSTSPFTDDEAWNVIVLDKQQPQSMEGVDASYLLLAAVGVVAAAFGLLLQRKLKARRDANQQQEDVSALYSLLDDDVVKRSA